MLTYYKYFAEKVMISHISGDNSVNFFFFVNFKFFLPLDIASGERTSQGVIGNLRRVFSVYVYS